MPAYDYRCTVCDHIFEVTRKAGSSAPEVCPDCGGATKRVFTPVGVVFKGSGFHNTDYNKTSPNTKTAEVPKADTSATPCGADKAGSSACSSCPASKSE